MIVKRRVSRGVQWLDANVPGWRDNVNPRTLDIRYDESCVLGQVYRDRGGIDNFLRTRRFGLIWGIRRGFLSAFHTAAYNREWVRRIHDPSYTPRWTPIRRRSAEKEKVHA